MAIGRSDRALGAFYRRLALRLGKARAITATARKFALLFDRMLKHKMSYVETSAVEYDERQDGRAPRSPWGDALPPPRHVRPRLPRRGAADGLPLGPKAGRRKGLSSV
jgi:hypothetical protein